ncbi:MAG: hypothetical protein AAB914_00090 [Patescibacteria group bacterium]
MIADVARELDKDMFDGQISTAFLTGIVAETARFSNEKTTPHAMSVAGLLMAGGANAQLISTKLETPKKPTPETRSDKDSITDSGTENEDGSLQIKHVEEPKEENPKKPNLKAKDVAVPEEETDDIHIERDGKLRKVEELELKDDKSGDSSFVKEPPTFSGQLTANTNAPDDQFEQSSDPLSSDQAQPDRPMMSRNTSKSKNESTTGEDEDKKTLSEIEELVKADNTPRIPSADEAREVIDQAVMDTSRPEPSQAIGSTPIDLDVQGLELEENAPTAEEVPKNSPPPVPPPMMPPTQV